jgi:uncharacterized protein YbbK (DUF523 family)
MKNRSKPYIFISSCILDLDTQYNQESKRYKKLVELVKEGKALFFCAEQGGGLPTPRVPSEIEPGKTAAEVLQGKAKILSKEGQDVTKEFLLGANMH